VLYYVLGTCGLLSHPVVHTQRPSIARVTQWRGGVCLWRGYDQPCKATAFKVKSIYEKSGALLNFPTKSAMAARVITPPILQGPTAKEKKYDRQLRLWAASGQQALEEASVLLLNSGPGVVGVEALKNLILPGVGNFTIVDEEKVSEIDLGVNFFLTDESLGKSRAEECSKYLNELNPEVKGRAVEKVTVCEVPVRKNSLMLHSL
jgi:hypothetical protein